MECQIRPRLASGGTIYGELHSSPFVSVAFLDEFKFKADSKCVRPMPPAEAKGASKLVASLTASAQRLPV
jgi:hypothetical protein